MDGSLKETVTAPRGLFSSVGFGCLSDLFNLERYVLPFLDKRHTYHYLHKVENGFLLILLSFLVVKTLREIDIKLGRENWVI